MDETPTPTQVTTLVYVVHDDRLLLLLRSKPPNAGLWSPPGGKLEPGESPIRGALRELKEETGLAASAARVVAIVSELDESCGQAWLMFVVRADVLDDGPLVATDEGRLAWVPIGDIASLATPAADHHITNAVLEDGPGLVFMEVRFDGGILVDVDSYRDLNERECDYTR